MAETSLAVRRACDELSRRLRAGVECKSEEFLAAEPLIGLDTDAVLELLYTEFVVREQLGGKPRPGEWIERFPQWRAELAQLFEVHAQVDGGDTLRVRLSGTQGDVASTTAGNERSGGEHDRGQFLAGYELLQEIGRGGMGVVYQARQRGLGRIVALKMILPPHGERERARFRTEAEATARLSHPNIVSIYEIGQEGDRPFLSMEFVAGRSLDKQLADSVMAPRVAAELLLTLARAVAYAHEQGIVHRDLKPANIVLSADGTPKITDFGLAKTLRDGQAEAESVAIVGTPSYMSPEQCAPGGRVRPAADIYALGAILYETLTGRPPFRGQTALDILELVRSQEAVPPSRLAPKIPRDLETICLKCLAKQPQQRYASAAALAEDLRRFLGGEPILARPVGRAERAVRWCRRNPAVATLAGGIVLALVCGTTVSTSLAMWALNEKSRAAEHARQASASALQEQAARELAEYRFTQAEKAVEKYLAGIENNERLKEADFLDLRQQLLASAVPFYEDFIQAKPGDPKLEAKRGRALGRLASLRSHVGEHERAAAEFRQMQAIFQKLAADFPGVSEHRQELARGHHGLSQILRSLGKPEEAVSEIRQAVALQEELIAAFPAVAEYRQDLAKSRSTLGMLLNVLGSSAAAVAEYEQVFSLQRPLAAKDASNPAYRLDLSRSHNNLSNVLVTLGKRAEAVDEMRQGLALLQSLATEFPKVAAYRQDLASSHYNLGLLCSQLRKEAEAELEHRQALALQESLVAEYPNVPAYRRSLGRSHYYLARLLRVNRPEEAEVEFRESLALRTKLYTEAPGIPEYRADLAESYAALGSFSRALGKRTEAIADIQRAIEVWMPLLEEFPKLHEYRSEMASHMNSLAVLLREDGKLDDARRMHERAIENRLTLFTATPKNRSHALSLRSYYQEHCETALAQNDHAAAAEIARLMAQVRPDVAGDAELAARLFCRCLKLAEQDEALTETERLALAQSYGDEAVKHLREAVRVGHKSAATLKNQPALAPLHDRADFQQIIQELEAR